MNDPTGLREQQAGRSRTTRILLGAAACVGMLLVAAYLLTREPAANEAPSPSPAFARAPDAPSGPTMPEAKVAATDPDGSDESEAPVETEEPEPQFTEADVRQEMCADYGKRYLKARTGVELVRTVQLSQAAGCGWTSMLRADAATHDFVPEALKIAQEMEAEDVPTSGFASAESAEALDRMSDRIGELDRKVDQLRYRIR